MLDKRPRDERRARKRDATIYPTMTFVPEGLVLGAGTVLLRADGPRVLQSLRGQEGRVLALLSAFQDSLAPPSVVRNIAGAEKAWNEGDV